MATMGSTAFAQTNPISSGDQKAACDRLKANDALLAPLYKDLSGLQDKKTAILNSAVQQIKNGIDLGKKNLAALQASSDFQKIMDAEITASHSGGLAYNDPIAVEEATFFPQSNPCQLGIGTVVLPDSELEKFEGGAMVTNDYDGSYYLDCIFYAGTKITTIAVDPKTDGMLASVGQLDPQTGIVSGPGFQQATLNSMALADVNNDPNL